MALPASDVEKIASVAHLACDIHLSVDFGFSNLINLIHFTNLIKSMNNATCCELVSLVPEAVNTITNEINGVLADIGSLGGGLGLLKVPTNLGAVVGWIGGFINTFISANLSAIIKKEAQLVALIAEVATLASAIKSAFSNLGGCAESFLPDININIPAMHFTLPDGSTVGHDQTLIQIPGSPPSSGGTG